MKPLSFNANQILEERYLWQDQKGMYEKPQDLFRRVATFIASIEIDKDYYSEQFFQLLSNLNFLPNSPTLMNAGSKNGQLSACFALPIQDSLESIFTTLKNAALIHQSGGGTGFNFSSIRAKGAPVSGTRGLASGPVSFLRSFDTITECVNQGGRRRGANMGILNIDHPDIEEFIHSKSSGKALRNFNLSIGITDEFMEAVEKDDDWRLLQPYTKHTVKMIPAKKLWEAIVKSAWLCGDPGLIFLDTINQSNPTPSLGLIDTTNPCGEVPLLDNESCNLGSINLSKMLHNDNETSEIDWGKLSNTIEMAIRFLDNVITLNHFVLPEIQRATIATRKIGLGVMGWAEMLILLGIPYASDKAVVVGEKLMAFIQEESYKTSRKLAKERGVFPEWAKSIHFPNHPMRNATCNSIAPTGTISVIADTSYSIEPLFALAYNRTGILGNKTQSVINTLFVEKMKELDLWTPALKDEVIYRGGIGNSSFLPKSVRALFKTSLEIPWHFHLLHQRAFQKFTDNAVSKTVNLPKKTSKRTVSEVFLTAWKYKLKGITIYRDGSKASQVIQSCNTMKNPLC